MIRRILYKIRNFLLYVLGAKTLGVQVVVFKKKKVLLVRHTYTDGLFFVGGQIEKHESPIMAARRELREEVGITTKKDPQLFGYYLNTHLNRDDYVAVYIVDNFTMIKKTNIEIAVYQWVDVNNLPPDTNLSVKRRLSEYFGYSQKSDLW